MNRLKEASYDGRSESFTYDKVGNRLTKTTNDITEKYVYNVKNQLKELHNNSGINHFTYDKQGNTIKEESSTGNNIFEYNTLNQQVKAITKEGNTLVSRYDAEGLRNEIEENEKLTKFIFHKGNVLVEADENFNVISRFSRGYEVVAADIADFSEGSEVSLKRYYYSTDEQGSTVFITDKNQQVKNEYYYDAFGCVLNSKEEVHNRVTYTGQQFDGITGQYYLRARFYNPVIGRLTQEDIYRGDGLNLYAYCGNNPVRYYDPSGYNKEEVCVGKGRSAAEGSAQANNIRTVGESGQSYVYRTIRPDEVIENGLYAKNPDANYTLTGHVNLNSRPGYASQFISTTTDFEGVAKDYADKYGYKVVKIDLNKLSNKAEIFDLSTEAGRNTYLKGFQAKNFASASKEVDIKGYIPKDAITLHYDPSNLK